MNNAGVILLAVSLHLFSRMWRHVGRQASVYGKADKQTDRQTADRRIADRKAGKQTLTGRRVYSRQVAKEDHLVWGGCHTRI